jgi:hypothetical protein
MVITGANTTPHNKQPTIDPMLKTGLPKRRTRTSDKSLAPNVANRKGQQHHSVTMQTTII